MGEPRERPILMSGPMVRALLEGRKTQTRRVVRGQKPLAPGATHFRLGVLTGWAANDSAVREEGARVLPCPFGVPGDRLWVRETFGAHPDWPDALTLPEYDGGHNQSRLIYRADEGRGLTEHYGIDFSRVRWIPSIYMPRWASRLTLRVTSVRVERVQDISEADARAEGVTPFPHDPEGDCWTDGKHRTAFEHLWGAINGWESWRDNPWVWAVGFEVERRA